MLILNDSADFESRARHLTKNYHPPAKLKSETPTPGKEKLAKARGARGRGGLLPVNGDTSIIFRQLGLELKLKAS